MCGGISIFIAYKTAIQVMALKVLTIVMRLKKPTLSVTMQLVEQEEVLEGCVA